MKGNPRKRQRSRQAQEDMAVTRFKWRLIELGVDEDKVAEIAEAARRMTRTTNVSMARAMEVVTEAISKARSEGRLETYDASREA